MPPRISTLGRALRVLLVDDDRYSRMILDAYCEKLGYEVARAVDGEEAITRFVEFAPDVIIMDVLMPRMDGLAAAREIKSRLTRWVPIVFLTKISGEQELISALESGGDDFLSKPVSFVVFRAKMLSLQRTLLLNHQVDVQAERLRHYRDVNEEELRTAKELIDRVVYSPMKADPSFEFWMRPARLLSGDVIAAARTPRGVLHVMFADGVGHGLSAAINVMPITPAFYSMTARGHPLQAILREINKTIRNVLPTDRFISAIFFAIDFEKARLEVWNGGIPVAWIINRGGESVYACEPRHLPLGLRAVNDYEAEIETFSWQDDLKIALYSDGLIEAMDHDGRFFGRDRLQRCLREAPEGEEANFVREAVDAHLNGAQHADDMSFALIRLSKPEALFETPPLAERDAPWMSPGWRVEIGYGANELKSLDLVSTVMQVLDRFRIPDYKRSQLYMVLSELISNALNHGVLGLSARLRNELGGEAYYAEQAARLAALSEGEVGVALSVCHDGGDVCLRITVTDSGLGFDVALLPGDETALSSSWQFGRGIPLVRRMVKRLEFNALGNRAEALFVM